MALKSVVIQELLKNWVFDEFAVEFNKPVIFAICP